MIEAKHSEFKRIIFNMYINRLLKRRFASFNLLGDIPELDPNLPVLLTPNHTTWWDGFFVYKLNRLFFHRRIYMLMLQEQLEKFSFFRGLGAYGIQKENLDDIIRTMRYSVEILNEPNVMLCIYPQGELTIWANRPVVFEKGILHIIKRADSPVTLLPLAMHPEFLEEERPQVFFRFGKSQILDAQALNPIEKYARDMEQLMDQLRNEISAGEKGQYIFTGRKSISRVIEEMN